MARRRFFVEEIRRDKAELTGAEAEHLVRVLRVEAGQVFEISDNKRAYLSTIESARKSSVVFQITDQLPEEPLSVQVTLCPALFKFDRFEWMVEKGTELGVAAIHPFQAVRTDRGLLQASVKRVERWKRIALEASQQSRRTVMPTIEQAAPTSEAIRSAAGVRLVLDEDPGAPPLFASLPAARTADDTVALLIGPEGGWTPEERAIVRSGGWQACSLGRNILRAETAAIAALAIVRTAWITA